MFKSLSIGTKTFLYLLVMFITPVIATTVNVYLFNEVDIPIYSFIGPIIFASLRNIVILGIISAGITAFRERRKKNKLLRDANSEILDDYINQDVQKVPGWFLLVKTLFYIWLCIYLVTIIIELFRFIIG